MPAQTCRMCPETAVVSAVVYEIDEYEREDGYIAGVALCAEHGVLDVVVYPAHLQTSLRMGTWRIEETEAL